MRLNPRAVLLAIAIVTIGCVEWLSTGTDPSTARGGGLGIRTNDNRQHFTLKADSIWQLNPPGGGRFDASGLAFFRGTLLTLTDRGPELYAVRFRTNAPGVTNGTADLVPTIFFPQRKVAAVAARPESRFDCEGVAVDPEGNLYICEESERAIYRSSADGREVTRLKIDFTTVQQFFSRDPNASWEGIAIANGRLYLANERESPRIIVVDLASLKVIDSFYVDSDGFAFGGPHYRLPALDGDTMTEYTASLVEARDEAIARMVARASALRANAIVHMRFDTASVGYDMSEIVAYGTAVVIEPVP